MGSTDKRRGSEDVVQIRGENSRIARRFRRLNPMRHFSTIGRDFRDLRRANVPLRQRQMAVNVARTIGATRGPSPGAGEGDATAGFAAARANRLTGLLIFGFPAIAGKDWQCYYHGCHCHFVGSGVDCVWPNREIPTPYAVCLKLTIGPCGQFS